LKATQRVIFGLVAPSVNDVNCAGRTANAEADMPGLRFSCYAAQIEYKWLAVRKVSVINGFPMTETYNNDRAEAATFARSIARAEFGRFYWDDRHEREMRLSLAMARERIRQENLRRIKLAKRAKRGG
jgi:hypothetical protein